jgi:hypothetical protein
VRLEVLALIVAGAYLLLKPKAQAPATQGMYIIGAPSAADPGQPIQVVVQSQCSAYPADPLCQNTTVYGASTPGYDVCGTIAGMVC